MNDLSPQRHDKFKAYRARKAASGLKQVRMWVPDPGASGYWDRSVRAAAILRDAPEEEDTMVFFDALHAEAPDSWD